ncbi:MAG TPA: OsmC family protein [Brumimicrobium sp.]|nr:OsmC family protein [Brumimicrobium sp.]
MATAKSSYLGELRVSSTHINSGTVIETDAPVDNHGKGTRFSPTDLLATAYLDCMITIMGIYCDNHNLEFKHCEGEVEKIMASSPRRVSQLNIVIDLSGNNWTEDEKKRVEAAGRACPVAKSVSPDLIANITFKY